MLKHSEKKIVEDSERKDEERGSRELIIT